MTDLEVGSIVYRKFYSRTDKVRILELSEKHHTDSSMYYRDMKVKICGTEKIRQYRIPFYIENNQVRTATLYTQWGPIDIVVLGHAHSMGYIADTQHWDTRLRVSVKYY